MNNLEGNGVNWAMTYIKEIIENIGIGTATIVFFGILYAAKEAISLCDYFFQRLGIETKWSLQNKNDRELVKQNVKRIEALEEMHKADMEESRSQDKEIMSELKKLTQMTLDDKIERIRWEILDFSSALSNGRKYGKEQFDHIIEQYDIYEKVLEENDLENGKVDVSMEFIKEIYSDMLKSRIAAKNK